MSGQHSFASKAQWRWAFATHKRFARRWAHATQAARGGYKPLPRRKGAPGAGRALRAFASPGR